MASFLLAIAATVTLVINPTTVKVDQHITVTATVRGTYEGRVCVRITEPDTETQVAFFCLNGVVDIEDGEQTIVDDTISSDVVQVNDFQLGLVDGPRDLKGVPSVSNKVRVEVKAD